MPFAFDKNGASKRMHEKINGNRYGYQQQQKAFRCAINCLSYSSYPLAPAYLNATLLNTFYLFNNQNYKHEQNSFAHLFCISCCILQQQ